MALRHTYPTPVYYPEEDGKVSESSKHYYQAIYLIEALRLFYRGRDDVFVGGNLFVYYEEGDPTKFFSPDVMIALGVRPRPIEQRGSYRIWEEGVVPTIIIELTSESTRRVDLIKKPRRYAALGVAEYYLFDPLDEFLRPRLQGHHLVNDHYAPISTPGLELDSPTLSLRLVVRNDWLRLLNPATGQLLPTLAEAEAARQAAETALHAAEDEVARLRGELARLRGEQT